MTVCDPYILFFGFLCLSVVGATVCSVVKTLHCCKHNYTIINTVRVDGDFGTWTRYHLQCTKCGDVKCRDMH